MSAALEQVAGEVGTKHITAVAIAYLMQKAPYVFPIIGGRKVEHLEANLDSLAIVLTPEHMKYLESVVPFDLGFPHDIIVSFQFNIVHYILKRPIQGDGTEYNPIMKNAAYMEKQPLVRPIVPDFD